MFHQSGPVLVLKLVPGIKKVFKVFVFSRPYWDHVIYFPHRYTLLGIPPPKKTKAHFVLEKKYFANERILYECMYLEDCIYNCLDTSVFKKYHNFLILMSKKKQKFTFGTSKTRMKGPYFRGKFCPV